MADQDVLVAREDRGRVTVLTLQNPPVNGYSHALHKQLDAHVVDLRMDPGTDVIVIRGAGERFFCAGADIGYLKSLDPDQKYAFCLHANETLLRLENTPKLVIGALNGHTVGGGLEIALATDIRVGVRRSGARQDQVGLPEVELGVLPGTGGTQRLSRVLGRSKALQWMVEGTKITMPEAVEAGLIHAVFDEAGWWEAVMNYARGFCRPHKAAQAVGLIKRAVLGGSDLPLEAGLALERELQMRLFAADDAREGLAAFLEKRPARFVGDGPRGAGAAPAAGPAVQPAPEPAPAPRSAPPPSAAGASPPRPAPKPTPSPSAVRATPAPTETALAPVDEDAGPGDGATPGGTPPKAAPGPAAGFAGFEDFADFGDDEVAAARARGETINSGARSLGDGPSGDDGGPFSSGAVASGGAGGPGFDLMRTRIPDAVLNLVPRHLVERHMMVPVQATETTLVVAAVNPGDQDGLQAIADETGLVVHVIGAPEAAVAHVIGSQYRA